MVGVTPDSGSIYMNFQALNRLEAEAQRHDPAAAKAAAQQFESLFIDMMLRSMQKTVPKGGLFSSQQVRFFQNMMDHQVALNMARTKGMGLQSIILKQLGAPTKPTAPRTSTTSKPLVSMTPAPVIAQGAATSRSNGAAKTGTTEQGIWPPKSAAEFVQAVWPYAKEAARKLGVAVKAIVAQAALESGWGQHTIQRPDGASSYNLFGVKAGSRWVGSTVRVPTVEYKNGQAVRERATFRAYGSLAECFNDYASFIKNHPRYRSAVATGSDPTAYAHALQQAGYATDPHYAAKIDAILHGGQIENPALKNSL